MIVSINWLKKFTNITMGSDDLATLIGARLVEIEEVIDLSEKYKDVVIAKVIECENLEDSDHLNVTKLDDGGVVEDVERDENGLVQVVCGAPNVKAGMLIAWLPPRSVVPETFGTKEPFVLGSRKLRGVMSNGMIASAKELDLFDDHTGILEVTTQTAPGVKFVEAYELNDTLLDIENKSLTHRPDTFGIVGFAREVAGITGESFQTPEWLKNTDPEFSKETTQNLPLTVAIDNPDLSSRYQAILLTDADAKKQSPLDIQTYLARVSVRPISAVVDVTNYLMMLTGQPLHAFDYDKVVAVSGGSADIHVRAGREKETLELLDGRTIELTPEDIVIAAGETAIGLAGAMGGKSTEIDETTKTIILESATFNLYNLRATQMRHGIFSEAITRFTKGQPAELTAPVLKRASELLEEYTGATIASDIFEAYPRKTEHQTISLSSKKVNAVLGSNYTTEDMLDTLKSVEFDVSMTDENNGTLNVKAPYWRADIHIDEDIIEEIGRLNGFDNVTPTLAKRDFTAVMLSEADELKAKIRKTLVRGGSNEILTYSFVHGNVLKNASQKVEDSYRITNSISPDLQYYRQTLTPSLLGVVHSNIKAGFDEFAVFELNKTHNKVHGLNEENIPGELNMLALTVSSKKTKNGAPFYAAKRAFDFLANSLGLEPVYESVKSDPGYPVTAPFEYRRAAMISDKNSGTFLGIVGEYKKSVSKNFKLPEYTAGFEVGVEALLTAVGQKKPSYKPLSRYPSTERDICFQVNENVTYAQILTSVDEVLAQTDLETMVSPVDLYAPSEGSLKNITIRIKLTSHDKTLTGDEAASVINTVIDAVGQATDATVI
jgi:phenylalanyl-tRNA synthetase beta chain